MNWFTDETESAAYAPLRMTIETKSSNVRTALDTVSSLAIVATCGVLVWFILSLGATRSGAVKEISLPSEPVSVDGSATLGNLSAQAVLLVYSDFLCPFCARFSRDVMPELQKSYITPGRLRLVFRHLALPAIHPSAIAAATAAECAGTVGKFWQMHDLLFAAPKGAGELVFAKLGEQSGLSWEERKACSSELVATKIRKRIETDMAEAAAMGIRGTPSFVLGRSIPDGRVRLVKALRAGPYERLQAAIDSMIADEK